MAMDGFLNDDSKTQLRNNCRNAGHRKKSYQELNKVVPSFIRRAESAITYQKVLSFYEQMEADLKAVSKLQRSFLDKIELRCQIDLLRSRRPYRVAAALLFHQSDVGLVRIARVLQKISEEELARILEAASLPRKSPA